MAKKPIKKQIKTYNYRKKNGKFVKVPSHKRTYHIGKTKKKPAQIRQQKYCTGCGNPKKPLYTVKFDKKDEFGNNEGKYCSSCLNDLKEQEKTQEAVLNVSKQFSTFEKSDWDGFAGAEKFVDGTNPIVAWEHDKIETGKQGYIIMDGQGIEFCYDTGNLETSHIYTKTEGFISSEEAYNWLNNEIKNSGGKLTKEYMKKNYTELDIY